MRAHIYYLFRMCEQRPYMTSNNIRNIHIL